MIRIIAAIDRNNALGYENKLLCSLPNDMRHFKQTTTGHTVVMGRKTFESIGKLLPNRANIILSSDANYKVEGAIVFNSIDEVLRHYHSYFIQSDLYIVGGQSIYEQFLPYANEINLTIIDHKFSETDTFFPLLDDSWKFKQSNENDADDNNQYAHWFVTYENCRKVNE